MAIKTSESAEDALIALIANEQKGLRKILLVGIIVLLLVVAVSVGLAFYYSKFTSDLAKNTARLNQQAFTLRLQMDRQLNDAADQDADIRRAYDEIRLAGDLDSTPPTIDDALDAAATYLRWGEVTLSAERLIGTAQSADSDADATTLFRGVSNLIAWQRLGERIEKTDTALPVELRAAQTSFEQLTSHPSLSALAHTGLAHIYYENASSARSNYAPKDCQSVFDAISESQPDRVPGPLPLYWQAQCERKLGRNDAALLAYAQSLSATQAEMHNGKPASSFLVDSSASELLMNACHGLGTVSISPIDTRTNSSLASASESALAACDPTNAPQGSPETRLAHACLGKAIELRESLGQTENQRNGTRENISFVYLRDGDIMGALENAKRVEKNGLHAWNELIRALTSELLQETADESILDKMDLEKIEIDAKRNISMFQAAEFNICEIQTLLQEDHFERALQIFQSQHPKFELSCQ